MKRLLSILVLIFGFTANAQNEDPCYSVNDYNLLLESNNPSITKNFVGGWNMFGYPCSQSIDLAEAFSLIVDNVIIVKDNNGSVYMPEFGFNGIGSLEGGEGYQIKMSNTEYGFSFCETINWPNHEGCTDCEAVNFNQWANVDDGSCYTLITQQNIHDAVNLWCNTPDSAETIYGHISDWNVSNITDMSFLFYWAESFNSDISNWDVSNVSNMNAMFFGTTSFNGDISSWDVANVTDMRSMFRSAFSFNNVLLSWDVSNVTNMDWMFCNAISFNRDLSYWDVVNVTNMHAMFYGTTSFNGDISNWNVSNVIDMGDMFNSATSFNEDISNWNVSNVINMGAMFNSATSFNEDISNWNVSNVTYMGYMFNNASTFNSDISGWDVSNVTAMSFMFNSANSFNIDLSNWDVSNITTYMTVMFDNTGLSYENQCVIQSTFSLNDYWSYDWDCTIYEVGDLAHGGIVFYVDYVDGTGQHGLVAALEDLPNLYEWGCFEENVDGADGISIGTGYQNTMDIVTQGCTPQNEVAYDYNVITAAQASLNYESEGYDDWFLPSKDELYNMYNNLYAPEGVSNNFVNEPYWSSSEKSDQHSYDVNFDIGVSWDDDKSYLMRIRPIRSF